MKTKVLLFSVVMIIGISIASWVLFPDAAIAGNRSSITIQFTGMNPHVGQMLGARLISKYDLMEVDRVIIPSIPSASFEITFNGIEEGQSYFIDMFADLNGNGIYDKPPTDHAWRMSVDNVNGDEILGFSHNTNFYDIDWRYMMTLDLSGMTPHVGQHFEARLIDINRNFKETGRAIIDAIPSAAFSVKLPYMEYGHSYYVEFFADLNGNGRFDPAPTDHTWRMNVMDIEGDQTLSFSHNTNFTDIPWKDQLSVDFSNMTPHLGQQIMLRVVNTLNNKETSRYYRTIDVADFDIDVPAMTYGSDYRVDFFVDYNGNGEYDAPPTDHAWRLETTDDSGNKTLIFSHNTNFTDIDWKYMVTLEATDMNPHLGQLFELRIYDQQTLDEIGLVSIESLMVPHIILEVPGSSYDANYNIDFYADFNNSGGYDPPPTDHAWRITLEPSETDTVVEFVHNTDFTDINWPVGIKENLAESAGLQVFPNPAGDYAVLSWNKDKFPMSGIKIYSASGAIVSDQAVKANQQIDLEFLPAGMYQIMTFFEDGRWAAIPLLKK